MGDSLLENQLDTKFLSVYNIIISLNLSWNNILIWLWIQSWKVTQWPCLDRKRSRERSNRSFQKIVQSKSAFVSALDPKWAEKNFAHLIIIIIIIIIIITFKYAQCQLGWIGHSSIFGCTQSPCLNNCRTNYDLWYIKYQYGTEHEHQLLLKRSSRFQHLFPNSSWLVWGRASHHQNSLQLSQG